MRPDGLLARQHSRLRLLRRAPFFRDRWNETYGWHVAAYLAALIGCVIGFVAIAQAVTDGELITVWDRRLNHWIHVHSSAGLDRAFELYTHVGSFAGLLPVALVAVGLLLWRRGWSDAALVALALAGTQLFNPLAKQVFERDRPPFHDPHVVLHTFSFPSGHSAGAAAVYGALALVAVRRLRPRPLAAVAAVGAAVIVLLVGASRVYLGAHYPSDVVAGFLLGLGWLLVCVLALTIRERRRLL